MDMEYIEHEFTRRYPYAYVIGVDEVGRGCGAGPVVAAAVILPDGHGVEGITDSKKLSGARREALYDRITAVALSVGVGVVGSAVIDEINIVQATKKAMRFAIQRCVEGLPRTITTEHARALALIDGNFIVPCPADVDAEAIIKGDSRSLIIGGASIIAKVWRDRLMGAYDLQFPGYDFSAHKGYLTKKHISAIKTFGPTPLHRRSFLNNICD